VLKQRGNLFVTLQEDLDDDSARALLAEILTRVKETGARGVVVDISSLDIVDSFLGRIVGDVANCASILDARTIVCGMRPSVAITLVELGMEFPRVTFAMDIEEALDELDSGRR
jgi:rsbT antagonist protein RsbS